MDSNPRNNAAATRRRTKSLGPMLFDDSEFIRVPESIRAFVLAASLTWPRPQRSTLHLEE